MITKDKKTLRQAVQHKDEEEEMETVGYWHCSDCLRCNTVVDRKSPFSCVFCGRSICSVKDNPKYTTLSAPSPSSDMIIETTNPDPVTNSLYSDSNTHWSSKSLDEDRSALNNGETNCRACTPVTTSKQQQNSGHGDDGNATSSRMSEQTKKAHPSVLSSSPHQQTNRRYVKPYQKDKMSHRSKAVQKSQKQPQEIATGSTAACSSFESSSSSAVLHEDEDEEMETIGYWHCPDCLRCNTVGDRKSPYSCVFCGHSICSVKKPLAQSTVVLLSDQGCHSEITEMEIYVGFSSGSRQRLSHTCVNSVKLHKLHSGSFVKVEWRSEGDLAGIASGATLWAIGSLHFHDLLRQATPCGL
ncbi:hypothetical protein Q7C36_003781 [Tachysurus vachellii]|uniref:Uncharacterized protein n=1 Tax=Tachysurus vachellii TaxID=175792 RepID=A0AA88T5A1_TACVA|nr:hypothetical protein Q7C36_003781 [Tachysurus vachellii]